MVDGTFPHERYEILVADDGSTEPETLAILAELEQTLAGEPGFFRVLRLGTNSGGAARPRNRILDEAVGEYVFFVDSDDTIGSEALARIADALTETPADWVALHQVLVNGRVGAASVRKPRMDVPRLKALTTLTVHKVFRRAEIERQQLRFDEGLPSGQDISFAFSYLLNASRFLMLGSYDYYFLTRHAGDPSEPPHLSRRANTAERQIDKNYRILRSMLDRPARVRAARGRAEGRARSRSPSPACSSSSATSPRSSPPDPDGRRRGAAPALRAARRPAGGEPRRSPTSRRASPRPTCAVAVAADWPALRDLLRQPDEPPPPAARVGPVGRWLARGAHVARLVSGQARHRRLLDELAALRRSVDQLQKAQARLDADVRAELHLPKPTKEPT